MTNTCFSAFAQSAFRESIDEFDQENNIVELDDDLKAEDAKRLQAVEAEINADNDKFEKGDKSTRCWNMALNISTRKVGLAVVERQ